ncbi:MAG TPA: hypothetical protein VK390_13860 [Propionibacteriaceae bacterium]|nr:hypothetical protein [Propionibacteriaceae bacterium]
MVRGWQGPITPKDSLLDSPQWRTTRKYWRRLQRQPCARCGGWIDYTDRNQGPRSLVVGHIISRAEAKELGWPDAMTNSVANTQPECRTCSNSSGARAGGQGKRRPAGPDVQRPATADRW